MSFDIESMEFEDKEIEGLGEAFDNWNEQPEFPPALRPDKHMGKIETTEVKVDNGIVQWQGNITVQGGADDGNKLNFVRLSSRMFDRRDGSSSSQLLDMIKSSGIEGKPRSVKDLLGMVKHIEDTGKLVYFQSDLRTYCSVCASNKMLELTGEDTEEAAKETLKAMSGASDEGVRDKARKIYADVRKFATKNKNHRSIPQTKDANGVDTGKYMDSVDCPTCGNELRVQADITRWLKPGNGGSGGAADI